MLTDYYKPDKYTQPVPTGCTRCHDCFKCTIKDCTWDEDNELKYLNENSVVKVIHGNTLHQLTLKLYTMLDSKTGGK